MFQSANEATFLVDLFQILYFDGLFMGHAPRLDEKRILMPNFAHDEAAQLFDANLLCPRNDADGL